MLSYRTPNTPDLWANMEIHIKHLSKACAAGIGLVLPVHIYRCEIRVLRDQNTIGLLIYYTRSDNTALTVSSDRNHRIILLPLLTTFASVDYLGPLVQSLPALRQIVVMVIDTNDTANLVI